MTGYCPRCNQPFGLCWNMATKRCAVCGLTKLEMLAQGGANEQPNQNQSQPITSFRTPGKKSAIAQGAEDVAGLEFPDASF